MRKHYRNIYNYCFRKTGNQEIAEDLTQETFIKLIRSIHHFRFTGKFTNYLFTIAVNTCNDYYRTSKDVYKDVDINYQVDDLKKPVEQIIQKEMEIRIKKAINSLPTIQKDALILFYYHDIKVKDIAKIMNANISTTKSRLKQGRDKLEKILGEDDYFEK